MDFKEWVDKSNPEELQKIAENAQNELASKMVDIMFPLFEKCAEYTTHLMMQKLAEAGLVEGKEIKETPLPTPGANPGTSGEDNSDVDPSGDNSGLKLDDVQNAVKDAIVNGAPDKIIPFVQAVASSRPEFLTEVIKIIKVQLHDAVMKKILDPEAAVQISQALEGGDK